MRSVTHVVVLSALLFGMPAWATELRGRIDTQNPYNGYYQPLPGAHVRLVNQHGQTVTTYTDRHGFYYFYRIPPGQYRLIVNNRLDLPLIVPNQTGYDIPPVLF